MGKVKGSSDDPGPRKATKGKGNPFGPSGTGGGLPSLSDVAGLTGVLDLAVAAGDAIIFGSTRDGGAVAITLLVGDERYKFYGGTDQSLQHAIDSLGRYYADSPSSTA